MNYLKYHYNKIFDSLNSFPHLQENKLSYKLHYINSMKIAEVFGGAFLKTIVHSFYPEWYSTVVKDTYSQLDKLIT